MKLEESSATPLYQQVMDDIKEDIQDGVYAVNAKIPSETELSGMYSVSRITIRRAIEELSSEGYLTKKQGKGTYVNPPKLERKIYQKNEVQSFTDTCRESGRVAGAHLISCQLVAARASEAKFLGLDKGAQLVHVRRLRTADGVPIMIENNFFPREGFEFLMDTELDDVSIFKLVEEHVGRHVADNSSCTLEIVHADSDAAEMLAVSVGEPLFYERVEFLDGEGRPFLIGKQYIVGSLYVFNI